MNEQIFSLVELSDIGGTVLRTAFIFIYAFILLRLLGKRRLSHLSYTDLLLIIAFGSAVGDVMIYSESSVHLLTSVVAITVVALLVKALNEFSSHFQMGNTIVDGHPRLLVDKGLLIENVLHKEDMNEEQLLSFLREKGIDSIKKVRKAFIEPDGEISVIAYKK